MGQADACRMYSAVTRHRSAWQQVLRTGRLAQDSLISRSAQRRT